MLILVILDVANLLMVVVLQVIVIPLVTLAWLTVSMLAVFGNSTFGFTAHRISRRLSANGCVGFTPAEASWFVARLHWLLAHHLVVPHAREKQKGQPARFADCP